MFNVQLKFGWKYQTSPHVELQSSDGSGRGSLHHPFPFFLHCPQVIPMKQPLLAQKVRIGKELPNFILE